MALGLVAACDGGVSYDDKNSPLTSSQVFRVDEALNRYGRACDSKEEVDLNDPLYIGGFREEIMKAVEGQNCKVDINLECDRSLELSGRSNTSVYLKCEKPVSVEENLKASK